MFMYASIYDFVHFKRNKLSNQKKVMGLVLLVNLDWEGCKTTTQWIIKKDLNYCDLIET